MTNVFICIDTRIFKIGTLVLQYKTVVYIYMYRYGESSCRILYGGSNVMNILMLVVVLPVRASSSCVIALLLQLLYE